MYGIASIVLKLSFGIYLGNEKANHHFIGCILVGAATSTSMVLEWSIQMNGDLA
jgi:ACR3 family arsenite efflux pump ArsB